MIASILLCQHYYSSIKNNLILPETSDILIKANQEKEDIIYSSEDSLSYLLCLIYGTIYK